MHILAGAADFTAKRHMRVVDLQCNSVLTPHRAAPLLFSDFLTIIFAPELLLCANFRTICDIAPPPLGANFLAILRAVFPLPRERLVTISSKVRA
jgi:hypothetical protein